MGKMPPGRTDAGGGHVDLQVNGFAGIDFNADGLEAEALDQACGALAAEGTDRFLATVITDDLPRMIARIRALAAARDGSERTRRMVAGIHIEGPFLSPEPGYVGAHPPDAVRPADLSTALRLVDAGQGLVRMFTLAPEHDAGFTVIRRLVRMGICVAAGHADPDIETLRAAADAGLSAVTHLGNGCPDKLQRHDNIIVRALSLAGPLRIGFIADGVHLPLFALSVYLAAAGIENAFVVSDVMAAGGLGPGDATIGRRRVHVGPDRAVRIPGSPYLAGSAMSLRDAEANLTRIGRTPADIRRLLIEAPDALLA